MKAITLLINSVLPEELRDPTLALDKKNLDRVLAEVARRHPDSYSRVVHAISDTGRRAAYWQGETLTLEDMRPVVDKDAILTKMDAELSKVSPELPDEERKKQKMHIWGKYATELEKLTKEQALLKGNNLGNAVLSGARGNPFQLKAMLTTPALYTDYKDETIPLFVRRSFGEGLRPFEFLASTFGVRKGVISTKASTAESGDLAKQLVQAAANIIVTDDDCGTNNGLDYDVDDSELEGRVLAKSYGDLKAGTPIDKQVMRELRQRNVKTVIARSPMTCQAKSGICAHCLGLLPEGVFAPLGYAAGITAAQGVSEPLTQGALNCLVAGTQVRMADGSARSIEDVRVGELVLGADALGRTKPTSVTAKWDQGMQPCSRYMYRRGQTDEFISVSATEEHPVLCVKQNYGQGSAVNNGKLRKLKIGYPHQNLSVVFPTGSMWSGEPEPLGLFLGIYLGDGIRNSGKEELRFSCADEYLIRDLTGPGKKLNLKFTKRKRSHDWCIATLQDRIRQDSVTGRMVKGYRNPLKAKLSKWGLLGKYAHEKMIPVEVWSWDKQSVAALIAGFIATDGSIYESKQGWSGMSFASTSKAMLIELKRLMEVRLCVYAGGISLVGEAGTGNRTHDLWQFYVSQAPQIRRLLEVLPPIPGIKGIAAAKTLEKLAGIRPRPYLSKRVSVEPLGMCQCWDLTVDNDDHLFVLANGVICSNTKHGGGGFKGEKKQFGGFSVIDQIMQSPETFPYKAAVSTKDGQVSKIEDAPQGGKFIYVGGEQHYVLPGFEPLVKPGQDVEEGDTLSEGIADVYDVLNHRGLGEARRYYVDRLRQAFEESDVQRPSKLNLETLARATLDHVVVEDPEGMGDFLPDDIASYSSLSNTYSPPADTKAVPAQQAIGKYLQAPVLHFTINTRMTPRMVKRIQDAGIQSIPVSTQQPKFRPEMFRLRAAAHPGTDWLAKMHTSYLMSNLGQDAARGRETDISQNVHFAPRLAVGEGFGKDIERTGKF